MGWYILGKRFSRSFSNVFRCHADQDGTVVRICAVDRSSISSHSTRQNEVFTSLWRRSSAYPAKIPCAATRRSCIYMNTEAREGSGHHDDGHWNGGEGDAAQEICSCEWEIYTIQQLRSANHAQASGVCRWLDGQMGRQGLVWIKLR